MDVTRVNLLFTVTDRKGRFVTDLAKEDFDIIEGKKPQVIQEFTAESDLPLRLGILIDTSNSIRDRFKFEQEAAISFINNVIRTNQDKGLVVSFDTSAELVADLQTDTEKLVTAVRNLRPGGGTALYDAIFFACRDKLSQDQPRHKFRRAIVIVSDGDDNQSNYTRDQALEMAQKADVVLYAISTNRSGMEQEGDKVLKYYASETGGRAFFPFQVEDMEQSFENIANELRHQYNISYRPEPLKTDGLFHLVECAGEGPERPGGSCPQGLLRSQDVACWRLLLSPSPRNPAIAINARYSRPSRPGGRPRRPRATSGWPGGAQARFGCFIHWGVYSGPGGEWNGKPFKGYAEHLMRIEKIPLAEYKTKVVAPFNPAKFNADEWVKLIKDAGMGYLIITAKHHDGFAMWPSKVSRYNIRDATKFTRDPMRELADACRRNGIRFGFYYSHAFDWEDPDAPGNDWDYDNPGGDRKLHGG